MHEGIYFADAELPFHVWVREPVGESGYRWVLRERRGAERPAGAPVAPGGGAEQAPG